MAAPCIVLLMLATSLTPSAGGYGTHERLGLAPCDFLVRTHLPCPTCGMTTAFAAMAHGRIGLAAKAHPFGPILFLAVLAGAISGGAEALTGKQILPYERLGLWCLWLVLAGVLAGWAWQLFHGYATGRLPLR